MGRSTQGVRLIDLDEGTKLSSIERVAEKEDEETNGQTGQ
jgi:DNA gyrase subunit A